MSSHSELIFQAKKSQQEHLQISSTNSQQLNKSIRALVLSNSNSSSVNSLSVLDKITTIHQLDKQIDKQLDEGISINFEKLVKTEDKLKKLVKKTENKLKLNQNQPQLSVIDDLQRRSELVDQDLRILENSLLLINRS